MKSHSTWVARNAGLWVIGVTMTGNGLGLSQFDAESLPSIELEQRLKKLDEAYRNAEAHFSARSAADLLPMLD